MTDLRKLLIEARAWMVANEKHAGACPAQVMGVWGRCRCGFVSSIGRIDGALAEPVEPVATWETVHAAVKIAIEKCKDASGMRNSIDTFVNAIQITHDVMGTDTIPAPADQWRRVEDWQPIETAPNGVYAQYTYDLDWVEPPLILLRFGKEAVSVARWDWYYANGGAGFTDGFAWIEPCSGEPLNLHYTTPPDGWMPLPALPETDK